MLAQTATWIGDAGGLLADPTLPTLDFTLFELVDAMVVLSFAASALPICAWVYRAHANLYEAGIGAPGFSPGWAVGWFFVPFANLWKPYQAMRELWRASHHRAAVVSRHADGWPVALWWGLWILGALMIFLPDNEAITAIIIMIDLACASLLWLIIEQITRLQTKPGFREIFT